MPTEVKLPHLGESIDSSIIIAWHKQVGDAVKRGDELADLETDKATLSLEAPKNGVLLAIVADAGQTVYIGDLLAVIGREGESWTPAPSPEPEKAPPVSTVDTSVSIPGKKNSPSSGYKISPVARRKAKELGVDLASVVPADGRKISGADVEAYAASLSGTGEGRGRRRLEISPVKRLTGQRMLESTRQVPQFALTVDADMRNLNAARQAAIAAGESLGVTAILVYLTARVLIDHPLLNARFEDDGITAFEAANIGVATAADDGLRVPVIHDADQLSLNEIDTGLTELVAKARRNRLSLEEVSGGTFTISNLGMTGVTQFTPLVNPPQSAILGLGSPRAVVQLSEDGSLYSAQLLALTLACDHRVLDGVEAAASLMALKICIENFRLD